MSNFFTDNLTLLIVLILAIPMLIIFLLMYFMNYISRMAFTSIYTYMGSKKNTNTRNNINIKNNRT